MIRGPVLPHVRETLWTLVAGRLESVEHGLALAVEGVDCSGGQFGLVDGLARDAMGAPVLVLVAVDGDALLPARALAACEFLERVGDSLATAVPEANLCPGAQGRVIVVGASAGSGALELLRRLAFPSLHVCRLESFRIGNSERFAVRWLAMGDRTQVAKPQSPSDHVAEFQAPAARRGEWAAVQTLCERIDPSIRIDGDRYARRITWHGRLLGEVLSMDGGLVTLDCEGVERALDSARDVRAFGDLLLRRHAQLMGIGTFGAQSPVPPPPRRSSSGASRGVRPTRGESLRETMASSRLSPEEFTALGGPTAVSSAESEGANVADDVARIVAAQEGAWSPKRQHD